MRLRVGEAQHVSKIAAHHWIGLPGLARLAQSYVTPHK